MLGFICAAAVIIHAEGTMPAQSDISAALHAQQYCRTQQEQTPCLGELRIGVQEPTADQSKPHKRAASWTCVAAKQKET
jgi:hypothetical protein